jgi:tetraacyldisaccharide 4'-kinase
MQELRLLLYPFSILYDVVTRLRNYAFDKGFLKQHEFNIPVIAVGNLSTGGTGKTPMIEYLIANFKAKKVAVLSRGYGRKTTGYLEISVIDAIERVGDEPLQIKTKFKENIVSAVCEDRVTGIKRLLDAHELDVILLDDAYQHRYVKASRYILLTSYDRLYVDDLLLPAGNLRESRKGAQRANDIVVTKCPANLSQKQMDEIKSRLKLLQQQSLYFSYISYSQLLHGASGTIAIEKLSGKKVTAVTGIARPKPFVQYLKKTMQVAHLNYSDHHDFTAQEINVIKSKEMVITTEKDYMRLKKYQLVNLYYLPIETRFNGKKLTV